MTHPSLMWSLFAVIFSALTLPLAAQAQDPNAIDQAKAYIEKELHAGKIDKEKPNWRLSLPKYPLLTFSPNQTYLWTLNTNKGKMTFKLLPEHAPHHVSSFIYLTELGYYEGLKFHRVIKGFMAQGACPLGSGTGSPGYTLPLEAKPDVKHNARGTLSMARSNSPNSAGSQFFVTFGVTAALDATERSPGYTVLGRMVDGESTLAAIEAAGRDRDPAPPTEPLTILDAHIAIEEAKALEAAPEAKSPDGTSEDAL